MSIIFNTLIRKRVTKTKKFISTPRIDLNNLKYRHTSTNFVNIEVKAIVNEEANNPKIQGAGTY